MLLSLLTMNHEMLVAYYVDESHNYSIDWNYFWIFVFSETRLLYNQENHSLQPKKLMISFLGQSYMDTLILWSFGINGKNY